MVNRFYKYTKQIFLGVIFLFFSSMNIMGQNFAKNLSTYDYKPIHFGFTVGLNQMGFTLEHSDQFLQYWEIDQIYSIEPKSNPGFHLGPITNFRLGEYLDLRILINFTFSQRDLTYITFLENSSGIREYDFHTMNIATTSLDFPLLFKYKAARVQNYRPYVVFGASPFMDLAARKEIDPAEMPKIRIKQIDLQAQFGAGVDFYLPYFKLSTELKFGMGIKNMLVEDDTQYTSALKTLRSHIYMLSIHFE